MVPAAGRDRVPGYNQPVTRLVPELEREDLELEVGGARLAARRLLPGCGHAPHLEAPTVVIDLVVDWLSSWMPSLLAPALRQGAGRGA
jgi:pimeloyl-ACP methyl ester carboxylesterase